MLSRVADSLYWMGRYIERAENNARIADVNLQMLLDLTNPQEADPKQQWESIVSSLEENELFASLYPTPDGKAVIDFVSLQKKNPNSIYSCLTHARENARTTSEPARSATRVRPPGTMVTFSPYKMNGRRSTCRPCMLSSQKEGARESGTTGWAM